MKTQILIDDNSVDGAYNLDGEINEIDEFIKIQIDKIKMYIRKADVLAVSGYVEEHG